MKAERKIIVKRVPGKHVEIHLRLKWATGSIDDERQKKIFEGIGAALAAALDPNEQAEFMAELARAGKAGKKEPRKKAVT